MEVWAFGEVWEWDCWRLEFDQVMSSLAPSFSLLPDHH
jgi:hypothetical protein